MLMLFLSRCCRKTTRAILEDSSKFLAYDAPIRVFLQDFQGIKQP